MTTVENNLALHLILENYGPVARSICSLLVAKKCFPLVLIADELQLDKKLVSQIVSMLVQHRLVEYKLSARGIVEYKFSTKRSLDQLKTAKYVTMISETHGAHAALIADELALHGYLEMSSVCLRVLARTSRGDERAALLDNARAIAAKFKEIRDAFERLVVHGCVQRLNELQQPTTTTTTTKPVAAADEKQTSKRAPAASKVPQFMPPSEFIRPTPPAINVDDARLRLAIEQDHADTATTNVRRANEDFGDVHVYWRLDDNKMAQLFRDRLIVNSVQNRIDHKAGLIVKAMLELADTGLSDKAAANSHQSKPVTSIDIQRVMRVEHSMNSHIVDKYLSLIYQDSFKVIDKIGDFSGGAFCIEFRKAMYNLCLVHVESFIREKYGSKSLRIFKVLLDKSQLEQKQIEDFSMIPSKDCKNLVYNMLNDGLLCLTELSKASDHAPSRTFYLFYVDIFQVCKKLLQNAYKSVFNLMLKRESLAAENKRLLEKSKKVSVIVESLVGQGATQAEIDDVQLMISSDERKLLDSVQDHCDKIEAAELQLTETVFLFELFFYYHTVAPVFAPSRR